MGMTVIFVMQFEYAEQPFLTIKNSTCELVSGFSRATEVVFERAFEKKGQPGIIIG